MKAFLYSITLYIFIAIILFVVFYRIRTKKNILLTFGLVIFAIAADLFLFNLMIYNKVTLERRNIKFSEQPTVNFLPKHRFSNLISEDIFHNFRPALYKKHVAVSSYTVDPSYFKTNEILQIYSVLQDHSLKYPLYEQMNKLSLKDFIVYGFANIDSWSLEKRLFFSSVLKVLAGGFYEERDFYGKYVENKIIGRLVEYVEKSTPLFLLKTSAWPLREDLEKEIMLLFNLIDAPLSDYENRSYVLLDREGDKPIKTRNFLHFLYNEIPAREYFSYLFEKNISAEHTFVLLKDYYKLISANRLYKEFRGYHNLLTNNLLRALGVTGPILKYYPNAYLTASTDILAALANPKSDEDVLYLETKDGVDKTLPLSNAGSNFSYQILNYNPNILSLQYQASSAGFLYFSDSYDTYWNAHIDAKKTDIYKANLAFKAIKIPAGKHKVTFSYDPKYFRIALWVYYITFGLGCVYLVVIPFKAIIRKK